MFFKEDKACEQAKSEVKRGVADAYNEIYSIPGKSLAEVFQNQIEIGLIRRYLRPGLVLDGGCGRGRILNGIVDAVDEAIGLDFSRVGVATANRDLKLVKPQKFAFVVGDMEKLPFRSGVFSNVLCIGTLEYASPSMVQHVFSESNRVLKKGSAFYFNCWNAACFYKVFWKLLDELFGRILLLRKNVRLRFWSVPQMHKALTNAGFSPSSVNPYFLIVPWVVNFLKFVPFAFLLKLEKTTSKSFVGIHASSNLFLVATKNV